MNAQLKLVQQWLERNAGWAQGLAAPLLVITVLSMMVLPSPPWLPDTFLSLNIAPALLVLLASASLRPPPCPSALSSCLPAPPAIFSSRRRHTRYRFV